MLDYQQLGKTGLFVGGGERNGGEMDLYCSIISCDGTQYMNFKLILSFRDEKEFFPKSNCLVIWVVWEFLPFVYSAESLCNAYDPPLLSAHGTGGPLCCLVLRTSSGLGVLLFPPSSASSRTASLPTHLRQQASPFPTNYQLTQSANELQTHFQQKPAEIHPPLREVYTAEFPSQVVDQLYSCL